MNKNFTVYSKDGCNHCKQIIQVLGLSELNYVEYKLDVDFSKEAFFGQFGEGATFPQVVLNGEKLGGCRDTARYLKENSIIS